MTSQTSNKTKTAHAICAVKALIRRENQVLILSKPRWAKEFGIVWNDLPGGRVEYGELSPQKVLERELEEEIGSTEIRIIKPLHMTTVYHNPDIHIIATVFDCRAKSKEISLSDEHQNAIWMDLDNLDPSLAHWIKEAIERL